MHIVFRSVLRWAVAAGLLAAMPAVPKLSKVGRKVVTSFHRDDLERFWRWHHRKRGLRPGWPR